MPAKGSEIEEIKRKIEKAKKVIFKTPVPDDISKEAEENNESIMGKMQEGLNIQEVLGLGFKLEESEKGLMLRIEAFDTESAFKVLEKVFNDGKTEIHCSAAE